MKKIPIVIVVAILFTSCAGKKPLYSWGNYDNASYKHIKKSTDESLKELIECYNEIIAEQKGSREMVPPGVYADYGYILLTSGKIEEGKEMLEKEVLLYPESKIFIDRILKIIEE